MCAKAVPESWILKRQSLSRIMINFRLSNNAMWLALKSWKLDGKGSSLFPDLPPIQKRLLQTLSIKLDQAMGEKTWNIYFSIFSSVICQFMRMRMQDNILFSSVFQHCFVVIKGWLGTTGNWVKIKHLKGRRSKLCFRNVMFLQKLLIVCIPMDEGPRLYSAWTKCSKPNITAPEHWTKNKKQL